MVAGGMTIISVLLILIILVDCESEKTKRNAKPHKKLRKWIDCEVCRLGMAWLYKLNHDLYGVQWGKEKGLDYGEFELQNLIQVMCESGTQSGKWIKATDIIYNNTIKHIELKSRIAVKKTCNSDCKTVELSCKYITDKKEEDITNFIWDKYNNDIYEGFDNELIKHICKDICDKYVERRDNKPEELLKFVDKYRIQKLGKERSFEDSNSLGMTQEEADTLRDITDNIQNMARAYGFQYAQSEGGDGVHDYRHRKKLTQEQRRAQESDDFVIPRPPKEEL